MCNRFFFRLLLLSLLACTYLNLNASAQCLSNSGRELRQDGSWLWRGVLDAPENAVRTRNLKWELPIVAATGVLIGTGDTRASRLIQNPSLQRQANRWSNIGLWTEFGAAGAAYVFGCTKRHDSLRETGQLALEAAGAVSVFDQVIKRATNRQRPGRNNSAGELWEGGQSFASGHAAASFAIASVVAHRTHKRWLKWAAYGLASGVSLARYPAKQHFFSDILIGGTLGYVTGTYLVSTHEPTH